MSEARLQGMLRQRRRRRMLQGIAVLALVLGAALVWLWLRPAPDGRGELETEEREIAADARTQDLPSPGGAIPPPVDPPAADSDGVDGPRGLALAPLDQSDDFVRDAVSTLSRRPDLAQWLAHDALIRRFVAAVDNVAEGRSPRSHIPFLAPEAPFSIIGDELADDPVLVDPGTYDRYDAIVAAVEALDAQGAAQLLARLLPLMQQAYVDLGYPDRSFEARLKEAAHELLSAPIPEGPIRLIPRVRRFEYEDRALEDLSDAQKHLLRMGPQGAARVQRKVRQVMSVMDPTWKAPPAAARTGPATYP